VINEPQDIHDLPWKGNYYSDEKLFKQIDEYILKPTTTREQQREALYLMGKVGMGLEDEAVSEDDLDQYLTELLPEMQARAQ
jgi:ornithine cyclodeaminase/alanine dehydrogenase-like protein (mu-crystallin family)